MTALRRRRCGSRISELRTTYAAPMSNGMSTVMPQESRDGPRYRAVAAEPVIDGFPPQWTRAPCCRARLRLRDPVRPVRADRGVRPRGWRDGLRGTRLRRDRPGAG